MDLFITLVVLELFVTLILAALLGFKNVDFYTMWFTAVTIASFVVAFGWKFSMNLWSMPTSGQAAVIVIFALNLGIALLSAVFGAGKASESLRRRV